MNHCINCSGQTSGDSDCELCNRCLLGIGQTPSDFLDVDFQTLFYAQIKRPYEGSKRRTR
jgi:hypothetical protein